MKRVKTHEIPALTIVMTEVKWASEHALQPDKSIIVLKVQLTIPLYRMNHLLDSLVFLIEEVDFLGLAVVVLVHQECLQMNTQEQHLLPQGMSGVDLPCSAVFMLRFVRTNTCGLTVYTRVKDFENLARCLYFNCTVS
jgi:hypothetical protein